MLAKNKSTPQTEPTPVTPIATKTTLDGVAMALMAMGIAGISFGIYDEKWIPGLFGVGAIALGLVVLAARNVWNENRTMITERKGGKLWTRRQ